MEEAMSKLMSESTNVQAAKLRQRHGAKAALLMDVITMKLSIIESAEAVDRIRMRVDIRNMVSIIRRNTMVTARILKMRMTVRNNTSRLEVRDMEDMASLPESDLRSAEVNMESRLLSALKNVVVVTNVLLHVLRSRDSNTDMAASKRDSEKSLDLKKSLDVAVDSAVQLQASARVVLLGALRVRLKLMSSGKESMRSRERSMRILRDKRMVDGVGETKLAGAKRDRRKERKNIERKGGRRVEVGSLKAFCVVRDRMAWILDCGVAN
jgi:hypothetical protein